jgi:hypothetical protein
MTEQKTVSSQIGEVLLPYCKNIAAQEGAIKSADEAAEGERKTQASQQRTILESLAALATKHKYEAKDIAAGVVAAKEAFLALKLNTGEKAVVNFLGKAKNAMHPAVAPGYKALFELADQVFKTPKADMEPARTAWARAPLMVDALASATAKDKTGKVALPQSESAIKKFATTKLAAARTNPATMRNKIAAIKEKLVEAKRAFPLEDFDRMIEHCDALTADGVLEKVLTAKTNASQLRKPAKGKSAMQEVLEGASNL